MKVGRSIALANIAGVLIKKILPPVLDENRLSINLRGGGRVKVCDLSGLPTY